MVSDLFARRVDGSELQADIRLAPFRDGDKRPVVSASAIRDLAERRAISDALVLVRERTDRADRSRVKCLFTPVATKALLLGFHDLAAHISRKGTRLFDDSNGRTSLASVPCRHYRKRPRRVDV
jgi:hypothetical protein